MRIYHYSPFNANPFGHGGEKRTFQIKEFLFALGYDVQPLIVSLDKHPTRFKRLMNYLINYSLIRSLSFNINTLRKYRVISNRILLAKINVPKLEDQSVIVYEHHQSLNWFIPFILKKKGHCIISIPHNIETLVPEQKSQITDTPTPEGFAEEIMFFKVCDLVLTISKEEEWLLNLFGINAFYFPYFPSGLERPILENIARLRVNRAPNKNYLLIGTVGNPPTRLGLLELITFLNVAYTESYIFHIVGFGTDTLFREIKLPTRFIIYGSVDAEKLFSLYQIVDAAVINQKATTGSLTKIPELLAAGVPIIVNQHAARNYFNKEGLILFRDGEELIKILEQPILSNYSNLSESNLNFEPIIKRIRSTINTHFETN
jgi:glycosyltransferase involved in cell wall biosynthesis